MLKTKRRLDLAAIEGCLRCVQGNFDRINAQLRDARDPLRDDVIANMMAGYEQVDETLATGIDLFALGNSRHLLDLNTLVLFGSRAAEDPEYQQYKDATERKFYDDQNGGIGDLMNWWQQHQHDCAWQRAAGVYVRILSSPQLYIEGNHRTGALIMSYILAREGKPPFVLSVDNARAYFDPSSVIKKTNKDGFGMLFRIPGIKRRFAAFLRDHADPSLLLAA